MKRILRLLVVGLILVGYGYAYGEEIETVKGTETKSYCWGLGFNRVIDEPYQVFLQINGDVSYKFPNSKWAKDLYLYMGINTKKKVAVGVGYYLWEHRVGFQIGNVYTPSPTSDGEDNFSFGIFLGTTVLNYIWDTIKRNGDIIFQTGTVR